MSIKSELSVLKVNIQNAKDKLYTNLVDKGVTDITTASTLDEMANSVSGITTGTTSGSGSGGGNPFDVIGYTTLPQYMQDGIEYAKVIYDNWDNTEKKYAINYDDNLIFFPLVDTSNVKDMSQMFACNYNLEYIPPINTSSSTTMQNMFSGCTRMKYLDLSSFDTSNVTTMNCMFDGCESITSLDLSSFNTSNVTDMRYMFDGCYSLTSLDLSSFNTSNVTTMRYMFEYCRSLTSLDLSSFDTSNVTDMCNMFGYCSGLTSLDLSSFNTSNVTTMKSMFLNCYGLQSLNLSSFNTSNVTDMDSMFEECRNLTSLDLSSFDTSNVTNMGNMFRNCGKLQAINGYLDWRKITSYPSGFVNCFSPYPLRKLTIKNLGTTGTTFNFNNSYLQNWGDETDTSTYPLSVGARQSLVDSLLTYSYDRATNGLSTCTIQLQSKVKARLTSDEIAAITAKGFTIA